MSDDEELVPCPICGNVYIPESADLVCVDCKKTLKVDLAIQDLVEAIIRIKNIDIELLYMRKDTINLYASILTSIRGRLNEMHKKEITK